MGLQRCRLERKHEMKSYLYLKADGSILGYASWDGGFPAGVDPSEASPSNPHAASVKAHIEALPDFARWFPYDCPCPEGSGTCEHSVNRVKDSYGDGGSPEALVTKPSLSMVVDGVTQASNDESTPLDKTPGAAVTFKLTGNVPDGTTVNLSYLSGSEIAQSFPVVLTFTSNQTNQINLTAPAQGNKGSIILGGAGVKYAAEQQMHLRGWA